MKPQKILLVEDEALIRDGLLALLSKEPFVISVLQASTKAEFIASMDQTIDLVLLDFKLADTNGLELLKLARERNFSGKVIALTGLEGTELVINLLKAGVSGIVYKLDGFKEIKKTIEKVVGGETYFSEKVLRIIQKNSGRWDEIPPVHLSYLEKEMLRGLSSGLTTKEMAGNLKLTESTTETYRNRLMKKVGAQNTAALLAFAFRNGLLSILLANLYHGL